MTIRPVGPEGSQYIPPIGGDFQRAPVGKPEQVLHGSEGGLF